MSALLLIGGSGFFGKSFLDGFKRGLLKKWGIERIIVMARNAERLKGEAPELLGPKIELLSADITNVNSLPIASYVIHAAASTNAINYLVRPEVEKLNIEKGIFNYCRLAPFFHKNSKIVYISSGAVYGQQPKDLVSLCETYSNILLSELDLTKRDYAVAKIEGENLIKNLGSKGMSVSIARCFSFLGKYLPLDQHFAIGNFINDGLNGRKISVKTEKAVFRSYLYSDDLVDWLMTIAEAGNTDCPAYNVGSEEIISIQELAKKVANYFQVRIVCNKTKLGDIDRYIPCTHKAKTQLMLSQKWGFDESLQAMIEGIQNEKN
jgi:dTDP-glucose 4,6-dehydratase